MAGSKKIANSHLAVVENTNRPDFLLSSTSSRRVELLDQLGLHFEQVRVLASETMLDGEAADDYALRVATDKAVAGWERRGQQVGLPVMGADTIVVVDDKVFGKPRDREHGLSMLRALSGREHLVKTAVALIDAERRLTALATTKVVFAELDEDTLEAYWDTAEPMGKAGAYAIQGKAAQFVRSIEGSYSGVVGLPLFETAELLRAFGIPSLT